MAYRTAKVNTAPKERVPYRTAKVSRAPDEPSGILTRPGEGENFFKETKDFYTNPTATNQYYQNNKDFFEKPGKAAGLFDQEKSTFFQPGLSQNAFEEARSGFFNTGQGEDYTNQAAQGLAKAGVGQNFIGSALKRLSGQTGSGNQAQQAWNQFNQNKPNISNEPGLGAYYENAKRRAGESIGQAMAAQGAYGSSAAADQTREAFTNLDAERANREADYNLSRLAEQRGWEGLGGQLAGQASNAQLGWTQGLGGLGLGAEGMDLNRGISAINAALSGDQAALNRLTAGMGFAQGQEGLELQKSLGGLGIAQGIDANALARILGGGQLAGQVDSADLSRLLGGQSAAGGAQSQMLGREGQLYNEQLSIPNLMVPTVQGGYEGIFQSDAGLRDAADAASLGQGQEAIRGKQMAGAELRGDLLYPAVVQGTYNNVF